MSPPPSTTSEQSRTREHQDWARSPSAMVVFILLGAACLGGISLSASRLLRQSNEITIRSASDQIRSEEVRSERAAGDQDEQSSGSAIKRININTASLDELDLLPGIGPALGQRIIRHRSEHGPFREIKDITLVSGIGPRTLEKLRPLIVVEQSNTLDRADPAGDE